MTNEPETTDVDEEQPSIPMGADTLVHVLKEAGDAGYTGQLVPDPDGLAVCQKCDNFINPAAIDVTHVRRLEGASDAGDMSMVVLAACPVCGQCSTMTLGYGPNASEADEAVLASLDLSRASSAPID